MAVFPASIRLVEENDTLVYKFSADECRDCCDYLAVLTLYCTIKTDLEGPFSPQVKSTRFVTNSLRFGVELLTLFSFLRFEKNIIALKCFVYNLNPSK